LISNGEFVEFGTLGGRSTFALDINEQGVVVGRSDVIDPADPQRGDHHAFLYTAGVLSDLGTLPGAFYATAFAINDSGVIVGDGQIQTGVNHAWIYFGSGSLIDLNTMIPSGSGWELERAEDINNRGEIVGTGFFNGQQRAFLLRPIVTKSAETLLSELMAQLRAMNLPMGIGRALAAKLAAAAAALKRYPVQSRTPAVSAMSAFVALAEAQHGRQLTEAQVVALVVGAQGVVSALERQE
jgi:probable HAF family extracellular repeat protein